MFLIMQQKIKNKNKSKRVEEADHGIDTFEAESPEPWDMSGHHQQQEHAFPQETGRWDHPFYDPLPRSFSCKRVLINLKL